MVHGCVSTGGHALSHLDKSNRLVLRQQALVNCAAGSTREIRKAVMSTLQIAGIVACFLWSFIASYGLLWLLNRLWQSRVSKRDELLASACNEQTSDAKAKPIPALVEQVGAARSVQEQFAQSKPEKLAPAADDAEAKYRSIFEHAIEGIFQTTPDGKYIIANPALARMYGYSSPEELIAKVGNIAHDVYVDPARRTEFAELLRNSDIVTNFESEIRRADGEAIWISENARAVRSENGELLFYEGSVHETSAHKKAENLEQQKEAAEAANRAKSDFLANMSHEIRTPLNGVIGMLDLLIGTEMGKQQQRYAEIARASADLLLNVINDILDFSKIEAGKLELESTDFNIRSVLEDTTEMLMCKAEKKGLELVCHIPPDLPAAVQGDPSRLRQILMNLATNSIKFTDQGQVVIKAEKQAETDESVTVLFTVADTGIGIAKGRLDRLFKSFSQVDASTTRRYGGSGLGLAICRQLVELMHGEIGVESKEGVGSKFWFSIPLRKASVLAHQPITPDELHGLRILVVDDHETNREIFYEQLTRWKFEVVVAASGDEALEQLRRGAEQRRPYRLAILDGRMPEMDGFELARRIKMDSHLRDTTLLMLTSVGGTLDSDQMHEMGLAGYMTKPVRQSKLFDAIVTAAMSDHSDSETKSPDLSGASDGSPRRSGHILLAEDNEVNQMVAAEILQRVGFTCEVVDNGHKAVEALLDKTYDLVLMDCQMPIMDGLTATRAIRERERKQSDDQSRRIPIIALTANAVKGDRERCMDAGMDGYISKPINPELLIAEIQNLLQVANIDSDDAPQSAEVGEPGGAAGAELQTLEEEAHMKPVLHSPFDLASLVQRCMGDPDFAVRILEKFAKRAVEDIVKLKEAVQQLDSDQVSRQAHSLKGAAANLCAEELRRLAAELEAIGRSGKLSPEAAGLVDLMESEIADCVAFVAGKDELIHTISECSKSAAVEVVE